LIDNTRELIVKLQCNLSS